VQQALAHAKDLSRRGKIATPLFMAAFDTTPGSGSSEMNGSSAGNPFPSCFSSVSVNACGSTRRFLTEREGAILAGLMLIGDERVKPIIKDVWVQLPPPARIAAVK
jgi:hypothetical protein